MDKSINQIVQVETLLNEKFNNNKIRLLASINEVDEMKNDLILFQKEYQEALGVPGKNHNEQKESVLQSTGYWEISKKIQLLELKKKVIEGKVKNFSSFSGGGSIGAGYLGFLLKDLERGEITDVIFGISAGSLFVALFLLWKKAYDLNPEKAGYGLKAMFKIVPQNLNGKTMLFSGGELIEEFEKSAQNLIDIINEKLDEKNKIPHIKEITIDQISPNFKIIATRKIKNNPKYDTQEVIFGGKDLLLNSIIASSNAELSILGIKIPIITRSKNKFYGNTWTDGYHSAKNQFEYARDIGIKNPKEYISLASYEQLDIENDFISNTTNFVPDVSTFISGNNKFFNKYDDLDQNGGWGYDYMKLKIIMSYYRYLSYSNLGSFLQDLEENIKDNRLINQIYDNILNEEFLIYNIGDIKKIDESVEKINNLKFIDETKKRKLILNVFYLNIYDKNGNKIEINSVGKEEIKPYMLRFQNFSSKKLPLFFDIRGIPHYKEIDKKSDEYILKYIYGISFHKDDEEYEKIILELISKDKLLGLIFKDISKELNGDVFLKLFLYTSIFNEINYSYLEKYLVSSIYYIDKYNSISISKRSFGDLIKKVAKLGKKEYLGNLIKIFETNNIPIDK
ncbi:patatin-like phospholipase family protein [Candidatus Gracilibacteria bacterium]|nr:patatin-like phospholipase family protein [Candidatus Gracilibacteria bacterium]NUJ98589.1 patatin-like phospholipase family protein [Candidatus Gracilibacteria bacterium]